MSLNLATCSGANFDTALRRGLVRLDLGALRIKIRSALPEFSRTFRQLYADHPISLSGGEYDFDIGISPSSFWRYRCRRNVTFEFSGETPFQPMDVGHAHALFEWGLNWAIASYLHQYLILHSAVLEWQGCGVLLSNASGSGKSTLSAELMLQGWRLLSDELALINSNLRLLPLSRPVSLKNNAIDLIRDRHRNAVIGPLARDTHKGTIGHLKASRCSVQKNNLLAIPKLLVFPKWSSGSGLRVQPVEPGLAATRLIDQAFNYSILGAEGFRRLIALVRSTEAWEIEYSSLDDARDALEELVFERG